MQSGAERAILDIDFTANRAFANGAIASIATLLPCTNNGGLYPNADGTFTLFSSSNTLRYGLNGLLLEPAGTNLRLRSAEFSNASWTKSACTVTADQVTAPDGTLSGDLATISGTTAAHFIDTNPVLTISANTDYTAQCCLKNNTQRYVTIVFTGNPTTAWVAVTFDLLAGVVTKWGNGSAGILQHFGMRALANGWYLCWLTGQHNTTTGYLEIFFSSGAEPTYGSNGAESYLGDGSKSFYAWGGDFKAGDWSMPVATAGTSVTRDKDDVSQLLSTLGISTTQGTIYAELSPLVFTPGSAGFFSLDDGTDDEDFDIYDSSGRVAARIADGGSDVMVQTAENMPTTIKLAFGYKANDSVLAVNGTVQATDSSCAMPTATTLRLGEALGRTGRSYLLKRLAAW